MRNLRSVRILKILLNKDLGFKELVRDYAKLYANQYMNTKSMYQSVNNCLNQLYKKGLLIRNGTRRNYIYSISPLGIQKLRDEL